MITCVSIHIYIYIIHTHINIYEYIYKENKIVLVDLSEETLGGRRGKENVREWKILKQPIYI
jgi:hypothetical protein